MTSVNKALFVLKNIPVINGVSERGVKLIEDYKNKLTKDESQKQYLLQVLLVITDNCKKYPAHKIIKRKHLHSHKFSCFIYI